MKRKLQRSDVALFFLAVIGLAIFIYLYPRLYPQAAIRMSLDKTEIAERNIDFLRNLGYDLEDYHRRINFEYDKDQLSYLNRVFGSTRTNQLATDSIPVYYWTLRWSKERNTNIQIGSADEEEVQERLDHHFGDVRLNVDLQGNPIRFELRYDEDEERASEKSSVSEAHNREAAEMLADTLIRMYGGEWSFDEVTQKLSPAGTIHQYLWKQNRKIAGEHVSLQIAVINGRVQGFEKIIKIPKPYSENKNREDWEGAVILVLFLLLFILVVIYLVQRLRSDLMDFKSGLVPAIVVFLGYFIYYWSQTASATGEPGWAMMLGFVITVPFVAGGMWALYSVGESLTRETWAEKLMVLDTLRRKALFPELAFALFRGGALAIIGLGSISVLNYIGIRFCNGSFTLGNPPLYFWEFRWPSIYALSKGLFSSVYIVVTYCLFLITVIRRRLSNVVLIAAILLLLWSFTSMPVPRLMPYALRMGVNGLIGLLFVVFFLRYNFTTVTVGAIGMPVLFYGVAALNVSDGHFTLHGFILLALFGIMLVVAVLAYYSQAPAGDVAPYVPDYLQRIYEKERIQRELEIARNVQLTFLPRRNPEIKGMDIATLCLPAKEVGGDYYDFIEIDPRKLGVVIGDVSGKGISAAFYMTLTKGFLKSQAQTVSSPRQILINMNELFYANAERGYFISMIYGVFNLNDRTLTFARAGHNPMILRRPGRGMTEEISPPGIALGLEKGDVFTRTIEERKIGIEEDDVFLFYTDGLNEAQNAYHDEYGEDQLRKIIEAYNQGTAAELLEKIQEDIRGFSSGAPQHDDMTAVVIKIV